MGFFSDDSKENEITNTVTIDQNSIVSVESNKIENILLTIAVFLLIIIIIKIISIIRKITKRETQNEQLLLRTVNATVNATPATNRV